MRVVSLLLHSRRIGLLESDGVESAQAGGNFILLLPSLVSLPTACSRGKARVCGTAVSLPRQVRMARQAGRQAGGLVGGWWLAGWLAGWVVAGRAHHRRGVGACGPPPARRWRQSAGGSTAAAAAAGSSPAPGAGRRRPPAGCALQLAGTQEACCLLSSGLPWEFNCRRQASMHACIRAWQGPPDTAALPCWLPPTALDLAALALLPRSTPHTAPKCRSAPCWRRWSFAALRSRRYWVLARSFCRRAGGRAGGQAGRWVGGQVGGQSRAGRWAGRKPQGWG